MSEPRFDVIENSEVFQDAVRQLTNRIISALLIPDRAVAESRITILRGHTVIEHHLNSRDMIVRSEAEMLLGEKPRGTKIVRTDTAELYVFQGGDAGDRNNYLLVIAPEQLEEPDVRSGYTHAYGREVIEASQRPCNMLTPYKHPNCKGCRNYHGSTYRGVTLVCAIHPYGWSEGECPDRKESPRKALDPIGDAAVNGLVRVID